MPGSHSGMSRRWAVTLMGTLVIGLVCISAGLLMESVGVGRDPKGQDSHCLMHVFALSGPQGEHNIYTSIPDGFLYTPILI